MHKVSGAASISVNSNGRLGRGVVINMVWDGQDIVLLQFGGRPSLVQPVFEALASGSKVTIALPGVKNSSFKTRTPIGHHYSRCGDVGEYTFYSKEICTLWGQSAYIIGENDEEIQSIFNIMIKRKPVLFHEKWNMLPMFKGLGFVSSLESFGAVNGIKVIWDAIKVNQHLSEQVAAGKLKFWETKGGKRGNHSAKHRADDRAVSGQPAV